MKQTRLLDMYFLEPILNGETFVAVSVTLISDYALLQETYMKRMTACLSAGLF